MYSGLGVSSYAIDKNPSAIPQGSAFPAVCVLFFVIIILCALYGCIASYSKRVCVLGVQTVICVCGLICIFSIAIAALQHNSAAQKWINENWDQISENFVRVDKEVSSYTVYSLFSKKASLILCIVCGSASLAESFHHWFSRLPCLRCSRFQYLGVCSVSSLASSTSLFVMFLNSLLCKNSYLFRCSSFLQLVLFRVLVVNIKLRDAPIDGELDPIVSGKRAHSPGRIRSFRDSDDGAGLDGVDDEESVRLAPASRSSGHARRVVRGGNLDDGL